MSCRTCKWLDVPPDKSGRIVVRSSRVYRCVAPVERPAWPESVTTAYGFRWPIAGNYMRPERGQNCPLFEPRVKGPVAREGREAA